MKLNILLFIWFLLFPPQGNNYKLTVIVSGLKPLKGDLYISLHNRPEYFQVADSAFVKKKIAVDEETETVIFKNIPQGKYAISLYHDENQDGTMAVNEMRIPKEGYGFSTTNKVAGRPKFEQAAFEVNRNDTVEIRMIYHPAQNKDNSVPNN